jgi:phosphate acetyltransferase
MDLLNQIKLNAAKNNMHIVLPEGIESRTLKAAEIILKEKIARLTLLGNKEQILKKAAELGVNIALGSIVDPENDSHRDAYASKMVEIRKEKGLTKEEALKLLNDPLYYGPMMIKCGDADGELAGAINATGDVLRPAFQYIKTTQGCSVVSGAFLMFVDRKFGEDGILVFSDCAVLPEPTDIQLAEIAVSTAKTAKAITGMEPRVALLSFSTKGSAKHPLVDKVISATNLAQKMAPDFLFDGELQLDAALVKEVGILKAPNSKVAGNANVLVFPGLEAGNIGYKLVQRLAGAEAIGPILQGLAAPINDLSRGCSVTDIVNMVAITSNQAANKF